MPVMLVPFISLLLCWDLTEGSLRPRPQCNRCDEHFACDCSNLNLQEVPDISLKSVRSLDLSFNDIRSIDQEDFSAYTELEVLDLSSNSISQVAEDAFSPLSKLHVLDLSDNQLLGLPERCFSQLSFLKHLNLLGNKYASFGKGHLLRPLQNLSTLMIGSDFLGSVSKDGFTGIHHLDSFVFHGSQLRSYESGSFREILSIEEVTVSINGPFQNNLTLATEILRDLSRPETKLIVADLRVTTKQLLPFQVVFQLGVEKILLRNLSTEVTTVAALFSMTDRSMLSSVGLEDSSLNGDLEDVEFPALLHIREVYVKSVAQEMFYNFPALSCNNFRCLHILFFAFRLKKMTIVNSNLFAIPCLESLLFVSIEYLDISKSQFSDIMLAEAFCHGKWAMRNLVTFNISSNFLKSFHSLNLFHGMLRLSALDVSYNDFRTMPQNCSWPPSLRFLNLSSCHLREVTACLPQTLHVLDLSYNDLQVFQLNLSTLTELHLSGNRLKTLPEGGLLAHLEMLYISKNPFISFTQKQLRNYTSLRVLEAASDTYVCPCEFVNFFQRELSKSVDLQDSKHSYICNSPFTLRGTKVLNVQLSVFQCQAPVAFSILCVLVLVIVIVVMVTCHKLHAVWYLQMMWAWVQAKRRPAARLDQMCYDVFVSYSEKDSEWVEELLVPQLEGSQPPFQLCLHKRHFLPGGWIADNIMAAMEKSRRTLFIVTHHFVQSDWCRFELEYSHFRLFDAAILVLLEPIPDSTIPKRFCRLRKLMNSRTYLEWPEGESERARFWDSLQGALQT